MEIRTFRQGDETIQADIYNRAAAHLPYFKPATSHEIRRRTRADDFDPAMRFYAELNGQTAGYCLFNANGRVSYPWCVPGHEACAEPLFAKVLETMKQRGYQSAFAAYRADWSEVATFLVARGFRKVRDMVNYVQDLIEMPTMMTRPSMAVVPLLRDDVPAVFALAPEVLRAKTPAEFERHLFANPYFSPDVLLVVRSKADNRPLAAGLLITESTYANAAVLDSLMPCFRLGAFGTEFMQTKRIKGMFSLIAKADENFLPLAMELLNHAVLQVQDHDDIEVLAAQAPSDARHLIYFYDRHFRRQGSFPVFEKTLAD